MQNEPNNTNASTGALFSCACGFLTLPARHSRPKVFLPSFQVDFISPPVNDVLYPPTSINAASRINVALACLRLLANSIKARADLAGTTDWLGSIQRLRPAWACFRRLSPLTSLHPPNLTKYGRLCDAYVDVVFNAEMRSFKDFDVFFRILEDSSFMYMCSAGK